MALGPVDADAVCHVCLLCFPSRRRCIEHLNEKSSACLTFLVDHSSPLLPEQVASLDDCDRITEKAAKKAGRSRAGGSGVCFRLPGPTQMHSRCRHPVGPSCRILAGQYF